MFRPPVLLATPVAPTANSEWNLGSRGVYIRTTHGLLPPRAPDMIVVRTGQLTTGDFHPIKLTALSAVPMEYTLLDIQKFNLDVDEKVPYTSYRLQHIIDTTLMNS